MKINYKKILENTGLDFENKEDLYFYIKNTIDFLESHNKNYTKEQYHRIIDLKEILENIEM